MTTDNITNLGSIYFKLMTTRLKICPYDWHQVLMFLRKKMLKNCAQENKIKCLFLNFLRQIAWFRRTKEFYMLIKVTFGSQSRHIKKFLHKINACNPGLWKQACKNHGRGSGTASEIKNIFSHKNIFMHISKCGFGYVFLHIAFFFVPGNFITQLFRAFYIEKLLYQIHRIRCDA